MRSRKLWISLIILLLIAMTACTQPSGPSPATPPPAVSPTETAITTSTFDYTLEETSCPLQLPDGAVEGDNITCWTFTVPEQHAQPEGTTLDLTVAVVKSLHQPAHPDPLFMLAGGPGSSTLKTFIPILYASAGNALRQQRDVVLVEQRGTLYTSHYLHCDEIEQMNQQMMAHNLPYQERSPILEENLNACYQRFIDEGIHLSAYNSPENAADIAAVARTMGYDSYNLYGGSYGTMLAQHLMRIDPEGIRSVILDAVAPLRHAPNVLHKAESYDGALKLLFARCAADAACAAAYPDLESTFFDTITDLNAQPETIQITNPFSGESYPLLLTGDKLLIYMRNYLYQTSLLPTLPKLITDIANGSYADLSLLQSVLMFNQDMADGMYKSVVCSELVDFTAQDLAAPDDINPDVARVTNEMLQEIWIDTCEVWKVEPVEETVKTSVNSDIPTLLLSGEFDPTVPPALAAVAAENLSQAHTVTIPRVAHGTLVTSDCVTSVMLEFLENPSRRPAVECISNLPALTFDVPDNESTEIAMVPFTIEAKGIQGVKPDNWTEVQPGLFARLESALDQTLIIFDAIPGESSDLFLPGLKAFLNVAEFPEEPTSTLETTIFSWRVYRMATQVNGIALKPAVALGEGDSGGVVIAMMSLPEDADSLYESVFIPAMDGLAYMD